MKVSVTREDIDQGFRKDPLRCPIALALFRITGMTYQVNGTFAKPRMYERTEAEEARQIRHTLMLPGEAINFQTRFDTRSPVTPFEFETI